MPQSNQETILIVEDDPGVLELERSRLHRSGYATLTAATANEALAQLEQHPVSLALLDYRLPGNVDGIALYGQMKAAGFNPPVILVTGFSDESTAIKALRSGVRDFVSKSVEFIEYLPEAVERVLKQVVTERKLVESEDRFRTVANSAPVFIWMTDEKGDFTFCNQGWLQFKGRGEDEELGDGWVEGIHPDDAEATWLRYRAALRAQMPFTLEYRMKRADGAYRWLLSTGTPRFWSDGKLAGFVGSALDLTERQAAEEALRQSEKRYRSNVDTAAAVILSLSPDLRIIDWNQEAQIIFDWSREEALGRDGLELCIPEGMRKCVGDELRKVMKGEPSKGRECAVRTRNGKERVFLWNLTCMVDDAGQPHEIIAIGIDITQRKNLEAQLRQAQKMEAIGMLAGGVAHDFNNLLTVIIGVSDFLLTVPGLPERSHELIGEIRNAGDRAATLTRQLLAFSRKQILQPVAVNLNGLVTEIDRMLRRLLGEDIQLAISLASDLDLVMADAGQLEQVLINLAVNARDAMPQGGYLTIETHNATLDREYPEIQPGQYVMFAITDTGLGMNEATLSRIFEPFFTTKGVREGTGLGLATVYGIVKQSNGHIQVYSELGRGTTFKIYLPRAEPRNAAPRPVTAETSLRQGEETVLLVEDEDAVRAVACIALRSLGYKVLEARDGKDALAVWQGYAGPIDLLVTDVVMPHLGGPELAKRLCQSYRGLRVLYVSGYTDDAIIRHGLLERGTAFLHKPYTPTLLSRKIREVLESSN